MEMLRPVCGEEHPHPPAQAAGQSGWKASLQKRPWYFWLNISQQGALTAKKGSSPSGCSRQGTAKQVEGGDPSTIPL